MSNRLFIIANSNGDRYKPELDHIFPLKLEDRPKDYDVDIVWNLQPVTGIINDSKQNKHPKDFFLEDTKQDYYKQYDFLPPLENEDWNDSKLFIENRKKKMIDEFIKNYKLDVKNKSL